MGAVQQMMAGYYAVPKVYATWDAATKGSNVTLSNGNLTAGIFGPSTEGVKSTIAKSSGKWYWEITINSGAGGARIGCYDSSPTPASQTCGNSVGELGVGWDESSGQTWYNGGVVGTNSTYTTGDVLGFAYDAGTGVISLYKNNVLQTTAPTISSGCFAGHSRQSQVTANFGATTFTYTPPSGYNAGLYT